MWRLLDARVHTVVETDVQVALANVRWAQGV